MDPFHNWLHVWWLFFHGADLRDYSLWGIQVFWWGRFGHLLTFLAALVILVDIIGPEVVNLSAGRAHERINWVREGIAAIFGVVVTVVVVAVAVWVVVKHPYNPPPDDVLADNPDNASTNPWLILALGICAVAVAICVAVWAGVLWTLRHDVPRTARVASLVILVVGFHFDMLAA